MNVRINTHKKTSTTLLLSSIVLLSLGLIQYSHAQTPIEYVILNEKAERELNVGLHVQLQEWDEENYLVELDVDWDIDDNRTCEQLQVWLRIYPFSGPRNMTGISDDSCYYEIDEDTDVHHRSTQTLFPLNLWPFDQYTIPIFLEFNDDVRLKIAQSTTKSGNMAYHPNWKIDVESFDSSIQEMMDTIPSSKGKFENYTMIKFDIIISHPDDYKIKNIPYFVLAIVPMILIAGHIKYTKQHPLTVQVAVFTGTTILILTSFFALRDLLPNVLTIIELSILIAITIYAGWFFRLLRQRQNKP